MVKVMANIKRKKKVAPRTPKLLDEKYFGAEPIYTGDEVLSEIDMSKAYTRYNYFHSKKDSVSFLFKHYPRAKAEIKILKHLSENSFPNSLGWQARMRFQGCNIPASNVEYFNKKINELLLKAEAVIEQKKLAKLAEQEKVVAPTKSIQERVRDQVSAFIAEIEGHIDDMVTNDYNTDFVMYEWLKTNDVKPQLANSIARYYEPIVEELKLVKSDQDVKEGYSKLTAAQLKRFTTFINGIVSDCSAHTDNTKRAKAPRTPKPVSVEKQVAKVKYLKESPEYKLASAHPSEVIKAQEVWVFNVAKRQLTCYKAGTRAGFSWKGTTLVGFDPSVSIVKSVRKPEEVLTNVVKGGKRVLSKVMDQIKTKEYQPNGRMNEQSIIIRVIK